MYPPDIIAEFAKAQSTGKFCDMTIVCEGKSIPVHRIIVCSQSQVLGAACTSNMKEGSGTYEIKEVPYALVSKLVDFLYTGTYDETADVGVGDPQSDSFIPNTFCLHARMLALGEMYLVNRLRYVASVRYSQFLTREGVVTGDFLESVGDIFTRTPDFITELRREAVRFTMSCVRNGHIDDEERIFLNVVMDQVPEFAKELALAYMKIPYQAGCGRHELAKPGCLTLACQCIILQDERLIEY